VGDLLQPWHILLLLFILPVFLLVAILPYWMIFKKAGFSPALSLLMIIPLVSLVVLFVVAFSDWKVMPVPQAAWPPQFPYPPYPPQPPVPPQA
jgi:hypothetical protein